MCFQDARDGTIALVVSATASSHLHVVRVDALDSLECSWKVEFRREVVYHLQRLALLCNFCDIPTFSSSPRTPVTPRASWKEWTLIVPLNAIVLNSSWMLSSTSLFTSSVSRIFLFQSCSARRARLDAIWPQPAYALPRCGVPRKMMSLVRLRTVSDRRIACSSKSAQLALFGGLQSPYIFEDDTTKTVYYERKRFLQRRQTWLLKDLAIGLAHTPLSISRSSLTDRSRPCCEMLFLLLAWKRPPMTSALYPYVHTQARGMSRARYSSGQKTVDGADDGAGEDDVGLEERPEEGRCACAVSVAGDLAVRRLSKNPRPLNFLVVSLPPLLALALSVVPAAAAASHVPRGWPRRPWTNTILRNVSRSFATRAKVTLLQAELVVVLRAGCQPREAEPVHGRHAYCRCGGASRCGALLRCAATNSRADFRSSLVCSANASIRRVAKAMASAAMEGRLQTAWTSASRTAAAAGACALARALRCQPYWSAPPWRAPSSSA